MISAPPTKINQHKFLLELQDHQFEILKKINGLKKPRAEENVYDCVYSSNKFSNVEKFTFKVGALIQEINFKIDKIQMCYFLIKEYPYDELWDVPLTRGEFIEYHMEAYLVHSLGLIDRVLAATNFLFGLKSEEGKSISGRVVLEKIKGSQFYNPLKKFIDMSSSLRKFRNFVVHEYRFSAPKLDYIISEDIVLRGRYLNDPHKGAEQMMKIEKKYDSLLSDILETIVLNDKDLEKNYVNILNGFELQFENRLNSMSVYQEEIK